MKARKRGRRGLAFLLAFALVFTTFVSDLSVVNAQENANTESSEGEASKETADKPEKEEKKQEPEKKETPKKEENKADDKKPAKETKPEEPEKAEETKKDSEPAKAETEVKDNGSESADAKTDENKAEEPKADSPSKEEAKEDNKDDAKEKAEKYTVRFKVNNSDAGVITVAGSSVNAASYKKDVEEGKDFKFSVTAKEGFEVESVKTENVDVAKNGAVKDGYIVKEIKKNTEIAVQYKEVPKEDTEKTPEGEEEAPEGEEEVPEETEEIPETVKAFLDAVAALPSADQVTKENVEKIGEQVNVVLDMWDAMDEELAEREDVQAALQKVYALYEAVLKAEGVEDTKGYSEARLPYECSDGVTKSAFENAVNLGQSDTCYGIVKLNGKDEYDKGTPNVWATGGWSGSVNVTGYNWVHISNSNPNVATASYRTDGGKLIVTFKPGESNGTTKISVGVDAKYPHYSLGTWNMELNFDYTVTNGSESQTGTSMGNVKRSVTYDLATDEAEWGKQPYDGQYGKKSSIGVGIINDVSVWGYAPFSFYAQEMLGISVGNYDTSIATIEAYEINSTAKKDSIGNTTMKGVGIRVTGLKEGTTKVVVTPKFKIPTTNDGRNAYFITRTMPITVYIKVTGEKIRNDYELIYDANGGAVGQGESAMTTWSEKKTSSADSADFAVQDVIPHREGYTFKGWADTNAAEIAQYQAGDTITLYKENPTKTIYAKWKENDSKAPDVPKRDDLHGILRNFVKVHDVTEKHEDKVYCTWTGTLDGRYESEVGSVEEVNGEYYCNVTLNGEVYAAMYACEPSFGVGEKHTLVTPGETQTIRLKYDNASGKWKEATGAAEGTVLATFNVQCKVSEITGFEKELVKSEDDVPDGMPVSGIAYPNEEGKVIIPDNGTSVTLLYKITVKGTPGKAYKVTDQGATWVGGGSMEGNIPESGETVIYVTKAFKNSDIKNGNVVNTAKVTPGTGGDSSTTSTETTPVDTPKDTTLEVTKTADKDSAVKGEIVTYTVTVKNTGKYEAKNVIITDKLDDSKLEFVRAELGAEIYETEPADGKYTVESIPAGGSAILKITARVKDSVKTEDVIHNTADAELDNPAGDVTPGNKDVTVGGSPLDVTKSRITDTEVVAGATIKWRITITNNTNKDKTVTISDVLSNQENITVTEDEEGTKPVVSVTLASGETKTLYASYVTKETDINTTLKNTVTVTPDNGDEKNAEDEGTKVVSQDRKITISYVSDAGETLKETAVITKKDDGMPFKDGDKYNVESEIPESIDLDGHHYIMESVKGEPNGMINGDVNIEVVYTVDDIGPDGGSDGIPDRYQATVTYRAVNGTMNGVENGLYSFVVTLRDESGEPSETGKAVLTAEQLPVTSASDGYNPEGIWEPSEPVIGTEITGDITFTVTYSRAEEGIIPTPIPTPIPGPMPTPTPPGDITPDALTPAPAPAQAAPTPAPAAAPQAALTPVVTPLTQVDDPQVPLAAQPEVGVEPLQQVDDGEVPLAAGPHNHKCCILHFLIMLLALILELFYTKNMKKHQKKIFEARREIADFDIKHGSKAA